MQSILSSQQPSVLIAEDHEDTRKVYGLILRHVGYRVVEAASGQEAVELARSAKPDLILMDIGLPVLDGWAAARALKEDPHTRSIPLIAFSALIDSTADLRVQGVGFDGFIAKPVNPSELVRRVGAYLQLLIARGSEALLQASTNTPTSAGPDDSAVQLAM